MMWQRLNELVRSDRFREFLRFCIVGGICTLIDAGVFYALHNHTGYRIAMIAGFYVSICVNYVLNIYWSFKEKPTLKNAIGILAAHLFNIFVVRMSLMWLFVDVARMTDSIAYLPTLAISMVTNFVIIRFVVKRIGK